MKKLILKKQKLIKKKLIQKNNSPLQNVFKRWIRFEINRNELVAFLWDRKTGKEFKIYLKDETKKDLHKLLLKNIKEEDYIFYLY